MKGGAAASEAEEQQGEEYIAESREHCRSTMQHTGTGVAGGRKQARHPTEVGGGAEFGRMEALTDLQRRKLEAHLTEEQEALEVKNPKGWHPGAHGGTRTRTKLKTENDRGAVAEAPD
jgi:hypothetical protein